MLLKSRSDTVFLPIVARSVHNPVSVEHATSSDGADFIIISNGDGNWKMAFDLSAVQHVNLPIFLNMDFSVDSLATDFVPKSLKLGASGVVMSIDSLMLFSNGFLEKIFLAEHEPIRLSRDEYEKPTEAKIDGSSSLASMVNVLRGIDGNCRICAVSGYLLLRFSGMDGNKFGGNIRGFSYENEHDLAVMVRDFLENGSSGAESMDNSDTDSGISDFSRFTETLQV